MAIRQQQQFKQLQKMSPQQILAMRLMALPIVEMEERIKNELDDNPALEEGVEYDETQEDEPFDIQEEGDTDEDLTLGDYGNEDDIPEYKLAEMSSREEQREHTFYKDEQTLSDFLIQQLELSHLNDRQRLVGEYIIGNIDDDGYLRRDLRAISDDIIFQAGEDVSVDELTAILEIIQEFDPAGIGARNLQECLLLQLRRNRADRFTQLSIETLTHYFDEFSRKRFDKIQTALSIEADDMKAIIKTVTSLNPKPGSNWDVSMQTAMNRITPDFIVETHNGEITMTLNSRGVPDLRVNPEFKQMLKDYSGNSANRTSDWRDAVVFVRQKIEAAQGFIDAVQQRQETMQRTMETIINIQTEFFLTGEEGKLRPMILKDVAERAGYDISTISRISTSKFVQTNFGVFPLKFFFSEGAITESGETVSTKQIKRILKTIIAEEDKTNPLTDEALTAMLKAKGYTTARRTVAKYREQMGIAVARLRREA